MGFWDGLAKTLHTVGTAASAYQTVSLAQQWMAADFQDLNDLEATVRHYVSAASIDELRTMDQALRGLARANAASEQRFEKAMWLFACLHGAWSVRVSHAH